jgi:hypothetical protein
VLEVRRRAVVLIVKREHDGAVIVEVGIRATEAAIAVKRAAQSIDTAVVVLGARTTMIWGFGNVWQHAEVIIEGMVLLHDNDDVVDAMNIPFGVKRWTAEQGRREKATPDN